MSCWLFWFALQVGFARALKAGLPVASFVNFGWSCIDVVFNCFFKFVSFLIIN